MKPVLLSFCFRCVFKSLEDFDSKYLISNIYYYLIWPPNCKITVFCVKLFQSCHCFRMTVFQKAPSRNTAEPSRSSSARPWLPAKKVCKKSLMSIWSFLLLG